MHKKQQEGTNHYLTSNLKLRMRSDVPVAFCLSGGIDSGILVSHAKKTFEKKISYIFNNR